MHKIAIFGNGMVGSTLKQWFKDALIFDTDPARAQHSLDQINQEADIIFISVPTPSSDNGGKQDLSMVRTAIEMVKGNKIIIIKSTVLPGTTSTLQKRYPQHSFLFNPEFLTEKTALNDFLHPEMQIIGVTAKSKKLGKVLLQLLPKAKVMKVVPAEVAESVKYFRNCFYATKVIFANQFYDFCKAMDIDYETVKEIVKADPMVGSTHLEIFHQGGRGAGGKCLAKDLKAFATLSKLPLLKFVNKLNGTYLEESKK